MAEYPEGTKSLIVLTGPHIIGASVGSDTILPNRLYPATVGPIHNVARVRLRLITLVFHWKE